MADCLSRRCQRDQLQPELAKRGFVYCGVPLEIDLKIAVGQPEFSEARRKSWTDGVLLHDGKGDVLGVAALLCTEFLGEHSKWISRESDDKRSDE